MGARIRYRVPKLSEVAGDLRLLSESQSLVFNEGCLCDKDAYVEFVNRLSLLGEKVGWKEKYTAPMPLIKRAPLWVRVLSFGKLKTFTALQVEVPGLK